MTILTIGYDSIDLDKKVIRLGGLFIERKVYGGGFIIFDRDPMKDATSIGIDAADALLLLKYLELLADEFKDQIAQQVMEARQK